SEVRLKAVAGHFGQRIEDLAHGRFSAGADVEGHARAALERGNVSRDAVGDVYEVSCLLTSAVDRHWLVSRHARGEDGHHGAFLANPLARAVDVRVAQNRKVQPERALIDAEPGFEGLLARAVWRERPYGRGFPNWQCTWVRLAVHCAA